MFTPKKLFKLFLDAVAILIVCGTIYLLSNGTLTLFVLLALMVLVFWSLTRVFKIIGEIKGKE